MSTNIILLRHGESEGNRLGVFQGQSDWKLTERGYRQAELNADFLERYNIDKIYSSDLTRAFETANTVAKRKGMTVEKNRNFREIYAGKWEGMEFEKIVEVYAKDYSVWLEDIGNAHCTDGESVAELQKRVLGEFERIAAIHKGKTVLVCTHGAPIRVLKCAFLGKSLDYAKEIAWAPNASLTAIDADKKTIISDGYSEYLGELVTSFNGRI